MRTPLEHPAWREYEARVAARVAPGLRLWSRTVRVALAGSGGLHADLWASIASDVIAGLMADPRRQRWVRELASGARHAAVIGAQWASLELPDRRFVALEGDGGGDEPGSFEELFKRPHEAAARALEEKGLVSADEFDAIESRFKEGAFVARLYSSRIQSLAREAVAWAGRHGESLEAALAYFERHTGLDGPSWYAETVVRTNLVSAYGAAVYQVQSKPAIRKLRPYVQYLAAGDDRVRPMHKRLHGAVFENGGALHRAYAPPLGFNCRCVTTTISERQLARRGNIVLTQPIVNPKTGRPYYGDEPYFGATKAPAPGR